MKFLGTISKGHGISFQRRRTPSFDPTNQFQQIKRGTAISGTLHYLQHMGSLIIPIYGVTRKAASFQWMPWKLSNKSRWLLFPLALPITIWCLNYIFQKHICQLEPMAEDYCHSQRLTFSFCTHNYLESDERHMTLEKQLFTCYWALEDTECMSYGHETILRPEISTKGYQCFFASFFSSYLRVVTL